MTIVDSRIVLSDVDVAREAVALFEKMNRDWWAGPVEAFIYNEFADALREAMQAWRLAARRLDDRRRGRAGQARLVREPADRPKVGPDPQYPARLHPRLLATDRPQGALARSTGPNQWDGAAALAAGSGPPAAAAARSIAMSKLVSIRRLTRSCCNSSSRGRTTQPRPLSPRLVERHGPIVHRVCVDVLGSLHEAQDAAQAVFLVLARKARSIRKPESLGPWLHGVALRVSRRARKEAARRRVAERGKSEIMQRRHAAEFGPESIDYAELHEEINRFPEQYRHPIILCYMQGQTQPQAARQLGWPLGTVQIRLHRGRERLRSRLTRRGAGLIAATGSDLVTSLSLCQALRLGESGPRLPPGPRSGLPPAKGPPGWSRRL